MSFLDEIGSKLVQLEKKSKVAAKEKVEFTPIEAKIVKFCTEPRVSSSIIELFPARPHNILGIVQSLVKRGILLACTNKYVANLEHRDFNVVMTMTANKKAADEYKEELRRKFNPYYDAQNYIVYKLPFKGNTIEDILSIKDKDVQELIHETLHYNDYVETSDGNIFSIGGIWEYTDEPERSRFRWEPSELYQKNADVDDSFDWRAMSYNEKLTLVRESGLPDAVAAKELGVLSQKEIDKLKHSMYMRKITSDTSSDIATTWENADDLQREELLKAVNITSDYIRQYSAIDSFDLLPIWLQNSLSYEKKASILPTDETLWKTEIKNTIANLKAENITFKDAQEMTDYLVGDKGDLTVEQKEYAGQLYNESATTASKKKASYTSYKDEDGDTIFKIPFDAENIEHLVNIPNEELQEFLYSDLASYQGVETKDGNVFWGSDIQDALKNLSKKAELDPIAADELVLYIENDRHLYERVFMPIIKNLTKKKKNNTYDSELAVKAFAYLAEEGAKKYAKEFGGIWNTMFDVATRKQVATDFRDKFEPLYENKEYDFMADTKQANENIDESEVTVTKTREGFLYEYRTPNDELLKQHYIGYNEPEDDIDEEEMPEFLENAKKEMMSEFLEYVKEQTGTSKQASAYTDFVGKYMKENEGSSIGDAAKAWSKQKGKSEDKKEVKEDKAKEPKTNVKEDNTKKEKVEKKADISDIKVIDVEDDAATEEQATHFFEYPSYKIFDDNNYLVAQYQLIIDNGVKYIITDDVPTINKKLSDGTLELNWEQDAYNFDIREKKAYNPYEEGHGDGEGEDFNEPSPQDYVMYDSRKGMSVGQVEGKFLGEFEDEDSAMIAIKEHMEEEQFWPNIWYQDDHGGISLRTASKKQAAVEVSVGDVVKLYMNVVKKHDNMPPYIRLVNQAIKNAENGMPYVAEVDDHFVYIRAWKFDLLGDVRVPKSAIVYSKKEASVKTAASGYSFSVVNTEGFEESVIKTLSPFGQVNYEEEEDGGATLEIGVSDVPANKLIAFAKKVESLGASIWSVAIGNWGTWAENLDDLTPIEFVTQILDAKEASVKKADYSKNKVVNSYLGTALWSSHAPEELGVENLDEVFTVSDFSADAVERAEKDWEAFERKAWDLLNGLELELEQVAHDFWLTRNHHGAGFWDGDYEEEVGEKLTEISHEFGEIDIEVGDDGQLYFFGGKEASVKKADDEKTITEVVNVPRKVSPLEKTKDIPREEYIIAKEANDTLKDLYKSVMELSSQIATDEEEIKRVAAEMKKTKEIDPSKALLQESIEKLTLMLSESDKIVTINAEKVLKLVEKSSEEPVLSETVLAKLDEMREKHRQIEEEYIKSAGAQMKEIKRTITQELKVIPLRANKIAISFKEIFTKIKNFFTGWMSDAKDFGKELDALTW